MRANGLRGAVALVLTIALAACAPPSSQGPSASAAAPSESSSASSSGSAAPTKVAKIGVLAPITGDVAADGEEMQRGAQLAVDEINAAGGVAGYRFETVVGDAADLSTDAVTSAIERISGDPDVNAFMTGYADLSNFEIDLMAQKQMPYLLAANATQTKDIISKDPSKYPTVWSAVPSYDVYGTDWPKWVESLAADGSFTPRTKTFYTITSDNPYSTSIAEGMIKGFKDLGWTHAGNDTTPSEAINDWRSIISKIKTADPDVVINTDFTPANEATFVQQFVEDPTKSLVYLEYGPSIPEFLDLTKENSNGIIYALAGAAIDNSPRTQEIHKKFKDKYGVETGLYGVVLYEEVYLYRDALEKVGDATKRLDIGAALGATDKETALGRMVFEPDTHLAKNGEDYLPFLIYQIQDGNRVVVSPDKYKSGPFVPPPWMK